MNANKRKFLRFLPLCAPRFAFIRVYSRLCLLAALLVAIAGRDLMAAPGVDVTQIVRSNCNAQGCRQTRVTHPGVILGRLSDGRMVAVCSASGRTRGMALIDPGTGEKEIAGTCVAVSGQLNAAVVTFAHAGQLASVTSVSAALQQYLVKTLGQMPVPDPACQPVGKGPPPPPETPPEVEELPPPPPPPPKHPAPAPAPATVSPNSPAAVNSSALSQLKSDLISETGKLLDEHKADLLQAVQSGVTANQNGISGLPAAVEKAIESKVPPILQEGVKDLATQEGQKALASAPGWLSEAAKLLGFNTLLGSAGGPVGLALSGIVSAVGVGKLLLSKFATPATTTKAASPQAPPTAPSHAPPGSASYSAPQPAPAPVAAPVSSTPAAQPQTLVNTAVVQTAPNNAGVLAYQEMKQQLAQDPVYGPKLAPLISKMDSLMNQNLAGLQTK